MLQFTHLALRRGARLLFEGASLQIHPGQKVGVTGANGCGKSSLFSLLLGELHADAGTVSVPRDWVIAHVAQETPHDSRAAIEYVLDGDAELREIERQISQTDGEKDGTHLATLHGRFDVIDGYTARSRAGRLLHGLGFSTADEERAVTEFSGGWRVRLNLARALMCRSSLLLLDEPTNHLDLDAVIWLEGWLRAYSGTLLLISHDRDFLDNVVNHVVHIEHGAATLYKGNYTAFERVRAERLALQQSQYEKQQREMAHMRAFVDRFRAKASKARQAQSRLKALERMDQIAAAHVDSPFHFNLPQPEKNPRPLLRLENIVAGYGDTTILRDVQLTLQPGDRIGLLGPNGAGKSTLIKMLAGSLVPQAGELLPAKDLKIGYFAQHAIEQLRPDSTPLEHLQWINPQARESELRNWLGGFGFSGDTVFMNTAPFSGGEKSRLALALLAYQRPNLLLLDEPTNHLDLEMRQALATALQDFDGAMVIVSHDRHLLRVATDTLLLVWGGAVSEFDGSLDEYPDWLANEQKKDEPATPATVNNAASRKAKKQRDAESRQLLAPLRKRLQKAERALEAVQDAKAALDQKLADAAIYQSDNKADLQALLAEQASTRLELEDAELEWLRACEELEQAQS
ncbi:MAG: ATP-binding cassette domain-containing protein [Woeseia sp.]